jgi:Helix-turn-helix
VSASPSAAPSASCAPAAACPRSTSASADLHRNYVGAIERGEINPTFRVLLKLERGLQLPLSEVVCCYERHARDG